MLIPPSLCIKAKGWDEEKQEWVFKEFMSHEFTWGMWLSEGRLRLMGAG